MNWFSLYVIEFGSCFTTEILEGFDVQRTSGLSDTLKKYGYLTQAIHEYYSSLDYGKRNLRVCPAYDEFIRRCEDLEKLTISDVFAVQLMQVLGFSGLFFIMAATLMYFFFFRFGAIVYYQLSLLLYS